MKRSRSRGHSQSCIAARTISRVFVADVMEKMGWKEMVKQAVAELENVIVYPSVSLAIGDIMRL